MGHVTVVDVEDAHGSIAAPRFRRVEDADARPSAVDVFDDPMRVHLRPLGDPKDTNQAVSIDLPQWWNLLAPNRINRTSDAEWW